MFDAENNLPNAAENPPLPFMEYKSYQGFCFGQVNFTKVFVLPLWEEIVEGGMFSEMSEILKQMKSNIELYEKEMA